MIKASRNTTSIDNQNPIYLGFIGIAILCFFIGIAFDIKLFFVAPFGLLLAYISILDYRFLYLLLFASIPFSIEFYLPNGLGTDLPTEPLMLILTGISLLLFLYKIPSISVDYMKQPILMLLILHVLWIFLVSITSVNQVVSFKFLLAKIWYVIPFYFLSLHLFSHNKDIYQWIKIISISLFIVLIITNLRHAQYGFSFAKINRSVSPFFRNHVNYAALIAIFIPFVWAIFLKTKQKLYLLLLSIMLISVYFSYTRAAYVTVMILPVIYIAVRYNILKIGVWIGVLSLPIIILFFVQKNNYLQYAPDFEKTIMNYEFDDLLSATYKMEDLSTMERVYRWVAGGRMVSEHPIMGFGPSTFYDNYKGYVVTNFQTYVSDNPEKSGVHNYFLMTIVEQGIIGFLLFLSLLVVSLLSAQNIYFRATGPFDKQIVMACIMSLISILAIILINDMLETDKLGPFFFVNLALLTHYNMKYPKNTDTANISNDNI